MQILITAGPTRERLDDVRFLSNRSTGKMGYALAKVATSQGHQVTLISGPVALTAPAGVTLIKVESAAEMATAVKENFPQAELLIMAAAVADYRPKQKVSGKIKKQSTDMILELERTEDILLTISKLKQSHQKVAGFAAEAVDVEQNALGKLQRKKLDWIVANDISQPNCGFEADTNSVTIYQANAEKISIPLSDKIEVATQILAVLIGEKNEKL